MWSDINDEDDVYDDVFTNQTTISHQSFQLSIIPNERALPILTFSPSQIEGNDMGFLFSGHHYMEQIDFKLVCKKKELSRLLFEHPKKKYYHFYIPSKKVLCYNNRKKDNELTWWEVNEEYIKKIQTLIPSSVYIKYTNPSSFSLQHNYKKKDKTKVKTDQSQPTNLFTLLNRKES